jgi:transcriptional regulator with GAF, ATPase, and Fis domain
MAAMPAELVESELFGHEKGAFTGAVSQKIGKFEAANGGTIFLDEIAELDLNIQSKILRVIQEREVVRVGGNKTISFDARLITATHKDLATEVKEGRFREDLYYRIVGLPVELPPLRNRDQDIILLADHFVGEYAKDNKIKKFSLEESARQKLLDYHYPGNVRELKAVIDLACAMADGSKITGEDITFRSIGKESSFLDGGEKTLKEYQVDIITHYLKKYNGNVIKVANKLDIGKSTVYNMIKSEDINIKEL